MLLRDGPSRAMLTAITPAMAMRAGPHLRKKLRWMGRAVGFSCSCVRICSTFILIEISISLTILYYIFLLNVNFGEIPLFLGGVDLLVCWIEY